LPVGDGGGLRANVADATSFTEFRPRIYSNALSAAARVKSMLNVRTDKLSRGSVSAHTSSGAASTGRDDRILPMSSFARSRIAGADTAAVVRRRRSDYQFWIEATAEHPLMTPVSRTLPPAVCPVGCPMRVRNRPALEARARAAGFHLAVHWRL